MGWRKMKMDIGMTLQPAVVLGLVGIKVIENDMNFSVVAVRIDDAIHEIQELPSSSPFVVASLDQASRGFQSGKKCGGAVSFVFMSKARNGSYRWVIGCSLEPAPKLEC